MTNRFFAGQTNYIEEMNALDGETGDHIADATGAHAATAISNTPAGNIAATTVQAAINELDTEKLSASATTLPASFTASSLTSVGTLASLAVSGTVSAGGQASFAAGSVGAPSVRVGSGQNGLYAIAANTLGVAANGHLAMRFDANAGSVNYLYGFANVAGASPGFRALGADPDVSLAVSSQGAGSVNVLTNSGAAIQAAFLHTASTTRYLTLTGSNGGNPAIGASGGGVQFTSIPIMPSYTVATLPAAGTAGGQIYVSNESGGAVLAFSDATNWRRVTDRAIVS